MYINKWILFYITAMVCVAYVMPKWWEHKDVQDTNMVIGFTECLKQNIKQDICDKYLKDM